MCIQVAEIDPKGKVLRSGGPDKPIVWKDASADLTKDAHKWLEVVTPVIGRRDMIVMKSFGLENHSMCMVLDSEQLVVASFRNSNLAKMISFKERHIASSR